MLTLREAVIEQPFRDRRYRQHRRKVASAAPRIDSGSPRHFPHVRLKLRQVRIEQERQHRIEQENIRLAHRMAHIMRGDSMRDYFGYRVGEQRGVFYPYGQGRAVWGWPPGQRRGRLTGDPRTAARVSPSTHAASLRLVKHRAPSGRVRVPRVGSGRHSPTPPLPHRRGTQHYRGTHALNTAMEGLSVRQQLEPLVSLIGDSRPDSGDESYQPRKQQQPQKRSRDQLQLMHQSASVQKSKQTIRQRVSKVQTSKSTKENKSVSREKLGSPANRGRNYEHWQALQKDRIIETEMTKKINRDTSVPSSTEASEMMVSDPTNSKSESDSFESLEKTVISTSTKLNGSSTNRTTVSASASGTDGSVHRTSNSWSTAFNDDTVHDSATSASATEGAGSASNASISGTVNESSGHSTSSGKPVTEEDTHKDEEDLDAKVTESLESQGITSESSWSHENLKTTESENSGATSKLESISKTQVVASSQDSGTSVSQKKNEVSDSDDLSFYN